jgi:hypothetical protein
MKGNTKISLPSPVDSVWNEMYEEALGAMNSPRSRDAKIVHAAQLLVLTRLRDLVFEKLEADLSRQNPLFLAKLPAAE